MKKRKVKKSSLSKDLCFCERYPERFCVRNGAKMEFSKTEWVSFSERIVAQSCDLILDSWDYWQPVKLLKEGVMC